MNGTNKNKVALVTGVSAGIGKAIARRLLADCEGSAQSVAGHLGVSARAG